MHCVPIELVLLCTFIFMVGLSAGYWIAKEKI